MTSELNAVGGFGRSTAEVKKKWVCTVTVIRISLKSPGILT